MERLLTDDIRFDRARESAELAVNLNGGDFF